MTSTRYLDPWSPLGGILSLRAGKTTDEGGPQVAPLRRLLLRFRRPESLPRSIVLRHIQRLQRCPGPDRLLSCGALLRSDEVAHEVDVSPVGNVRKWSCGLTQANVFLHHISVGDLDTIGDPIFPPTIEPVARAGLSLQTRRESESLSLEEVLGFLVVGVDHDSK